MKTRFAAASIIMLAICTQSNAQLGLFSKEQRVELTRDWKGERFPDGRPKVRSRPCARVR